MNTDMLKLSLINHARREIEDDIVNTTEKITEMLSNLSDVLTPEERKCYVKCLRANVELLTRTKRQAVRPIRPAKVFA